MFALRVELLMGRAVIARWDQRERAEWPPHPDRVFMALVAAWGEAGEDPAGRAALEWLESLPAPALRASADAYHRSEVTSYVPANDAQVPALRGKPPSPGQTGTGLQVLPDRRNRNARSFPAVAPADPTFHLVWPNADPAGHRAALERVCSHATYLGHSSTPVRVGIEPEADGLVPNLVPTDGPAAVRLRVFGPGRTEELKARFDAGERPRPALWLGYGPSPASDSAGVVDGPFDPGLIVFRQVGGRTCGLETCGMIAEAIRRALMARHGAQPPEWLSGHAPDGRVSRAARPAFVPLGFVGHEHADGHLLGVGLALPTGFPPDAAGHLFSLLARHGEPEDVAGPGLGYLRLRVENPALGRPVGEMALELDERPARQRAAALRPEAWTGPAARWATVTPVVLPQFPRRGLTPEDVVVKACADAGYPEPAEVSAGLSPYLAGVPHARSFHVRPRAGGRPPRLLMHAEVRFAVPVRGPVALGSGRYGGYGFCRPVGDSGGRE